MPEIETKLTPPPPTTQPGYYNETADEISLKDLVLTLWHHRSIFVVLSLSAILIIAAATAWIYLRQQNDTLFGWNSSLNLKVSTKMNTRMA